MLNVRLCGGVEVEVDGHLLPDSLLGGRQGRLVLGYLVCERDRAVRREELAELLWSEQLPDSWAASLSAVISRLRRLFTEAGLDGTTVVASSPGSYQLHLPADSAVDIEALITAVVEAEESRDLATALDAAARAETIAARGFLGDDCEWVDTRREAIRDVRVRAAIAESAAQLRAGAAPRAIESARRALELDPGKEAAYRQLMAALAAAGERAEALRVWERCRITLVEELGIDPSPETEAVYLQLLDTTPSPRVTTELPSGVVTFLLTDIVESSTLWEEQPNAMAKALERHDAIVAEVVAAHGGTLLKSKLEGDATVSVFARATAAATAALALHDALTSEPWPAGAAPRLRMAMHTGEAFERGGDYFGPALNRAARIRSLAGADEVLLSQAVTELVRDHLPDDVVLRDRGHRNLRGLSRGENVFLLTRAGAEKVAPATRSPEIARPPVPAALAGTGPFVGRQRELEELIGLWDRACAGESRAVFVGGEPGVGKSRLAGEICRHAHAAGALVLYGRCDEDLAAPLQPFIEAVRVLAPALGAERLRAVRGIDELTRVVPELRELLAEDSPAVRADPDTERLALFDAVTQILATAANEAPVLLVLDDLHWAGKTTLSLVRHLLRAAHGVRLFVVGTYRDTELARTHPLAATLADLRRDTDTGRITLGGLDVADVEAYLAAIGNTDRALGRELAEVTSGNPFFLIEVVRHVDETGGTWQPGTLPEGVRDATGRRLSRLSDDANSALSVAAVVGTTFDLDLVEQVTGGDLVDPIAEACQAGLVVEEPGSHSRFRFAHALVRQVLLAELVTLKRVRLHRNIAELLEAAPVTDPDARLADLAYHWFECASAGGADRAVAACQRAADRALERLAYEEAGDLYGMALQALDEVDDADLDTRAALHLARCDALLTAGDVAGARDAIDALELTASGSERLAAWYTTYEGLLAVLGEPDRLGEIVQSIGAAAGAMRAVGDLTGEAKAHYVHASALERLGQIGAAERALDAALAAARTAGDRRLADAILAEAPPAALWGPSPVTRASGRCLDVVRVLRITAGAPAVEAVSLRCQAVLEALRGRMDAARRMIRSSHRTVERLGLTHRRLEAEVAAGLIELLDGQAEAAETHLRVAYEELRARGLGGEAAQAGAFLGRALLLQDRIDEADEVATDAQELAGSDLKAAIAWRDVRAEVAVRRGDMDRALALAQEAVELASATDALLLVADARLALATVLRATGDDAAADAEAQRAVEACEAKGATVMADRARAGMRRPAFTHTTEPTPRVRAREDTANLAFAAHVRGLEAFNRGDWDAVRANRTPDSIFDDRRNYVAMTVAVEKVMHHSEQLVYESGGRFDPPELVATRGQYLALVRCLVRAPDWESPYLAVVGADELARIARYVMFEPEALDDALAELDAIAGEPAMENDVTRYNARMQAAFNAHNWEAVAALNAPGSTLDDRRPLVGAAFDPEEAGVGVRFLFDGQGTLEYVTIATRGRSLALTRWVLHIPVPEATVTALVINGTDTQGLLEQSIVFDEDSLDAAMAELDALYLVEAAAQEAHENDVTRCAARLLAAHQAHDWDAVVACHAPELSVDDRRSGVKTSLDHDDAVATNRMGFDAGGTFEYTVLATRGRSLALLRSQWHIPEPEATVILLSVACSDDAGRHLRAIHFDPDDLETAMAELDALYLEEQSRLENDATRYFARILAAWKTHDWDEIIACYAPGSTMDDRRSVVAASLDYEQFMVVTRLVFDGGGTHECTAIASRGRSLALAEWRLQIPEPEASATVLLLTRTDTEGRHERSIQFDPDDLEAAMAELDALYLEEQPRPENDASRCAERLYAAYNAHDWDAVVACYAPEWTFDDRRPVVGGLFSHEQAMAGNRLVFDGGGRLESTTVATRGRSLVLRRTTLRLSDSDVSGTNLILIRIDARGQILRSIQFDLDCRETAMAELDALYLEEVAGQSVDENDATRCAAKVLAAYNAHDWDALTECFAAEWMVDDRRSVVGGLLPYEQAMASNRIIFDGGGTFESTTIATRGRSLALRRTTFRLSEADVSGTILVLTRTDSQGRNALTIHFDPDDLEVAVAELDALYLDEQTRLENDATRCAERVYVAYNAHDWDAVVACYAPEWTMDDRRPIVGGPLTSEQAMASARILFDGGGRFESTTIVTRGRSLALRRTTVRLSEPDVSGSALVLLRTDTQGRIALSVQFDPDDLEAAMAQLEALYLAEEKPAANDATRTIARVHAAYNARDWDAIAASYADGYAQDDRRSVVAVSLDHEQSKANSRWIFDGRGTFEGETVATRGRNLALTRTTLRIPDPEARVTVLVLTRVDNEDRQARSILFDADDVAGAIAELDALFLEEQSRLENDATRMIARAHAAFKAHDWDAAAALYADDYTQDDRRSVVGVPLDHEQSMASLRLIFDSGAVFVGRETVAIRGRDLAMTRTAVRIFEPEAVVVSLAVSQVDHEGRAVRSISFDADDVEGAMAELDAWHRDRDVDTRPDAGWIENDAWRAGLRFRDASNNQDRQALLDTLDPAFVYDDCRQDVRLRLEGDDALESYRIGTALDSFRLDRELVATRGERLALVSDAATFTDGDAGPSEIVVLTIIECGADGRILSHTAFNTDDIVDALDALDARYVELGAEVNTAVMRQSFDARDWDTLAAMLAADCRVSDYRTAGWGVIDGDAFVEYNKSLVELAPDAHLWADHVRARGNVNLSVGRAFGTQAGGPWELAYVTIGVTGADGRLQHAETYELDDMDVALARFDELVTEAEQPKPNRARAAALDADPLAVPRNLAARTVGEAGWTLVSALGDRLCVHETPDGFVLHEVDEAGRVVDRREFARDDRRSAANEVARRFFLGADLPPDAPDMTLAMNTHDIERVRAAMAESCVIEDYRKLRVTEFKNRNDYVESLAPVFELAPDQLIETLRCYAIESWGHVSLTHASGTIADGGRYETYTLALSAWDESGLVTLMALYEPDDVDAALERLEKARPGR